MTSDTIQPIERPSTASEIAEAVGRKDKRIVLKWIERGCPAEKRVRRGGDCWFLNLGEVKTWLAAQGLDVVRGDEAEPNAGPDLFAPPPPPPPPEAYLQADGTVDWRKIIQRATAKLVTTIDAGPIGGDAGAKQKWSSAFRSAFSELRALEERLDEVEDRGGRFIDRTKAEEMLVLEAVMFADDLDALANDLPRLIVADLVAAGVVFADQDAATRVLAAMVRKTTDGVRRRRAESIRRRLGKDAEPNTGEAA